MFKILSFFIGLILLFFIFYYGSTFIKDMFSGNSNWLSGLTSGNETLLKTTTDSNGMFQDNSSATVSPLLERFFPGIFPLFKINPDNNGSTNLNNTNTEAQNFDSEYIPQEVTDYVREVQNEAKYPNGNINHKQDNQLNQVLSEVHFGK
jgi:hypothetical protein